MAGHAFDGGLPDPVPEAEVLPVAGKTPRVLDVDGPDAVAGAGQQAVHGGVQHLVRLAVDRDQEVGLAASEAGFPVPGRAGAGVAEDVGPGRHALAEFQGKGVEDAVAGPEGGETGPGDGDVDRARRLVADPFGGAGDPRRQPADESATLEAVSDPQEDVGRNREAVGPQDVALDVVEVEPGGHGPLNSRR